MGWPTPCQEHRRKRLQEALLSRFSSDRTQGSREALREAKVDDSSTFWRTTKPELKTVPRLGESDTFF